MRLRRRNWRKVIEMPPINGFMPFGKQIKTQTEPVLLLVEEYEALKLCDYDGLNHHQAAELMNISRSTFTRIYTSVRQKLAKAFVEGRTISIGGGKIYFDSNWYYCKTCKCHFNDQNHNIEITECALCGSKNIEAKEDSEQSDIQEEAEYCYCIRCGHKIAKRRGQLRSQSICADCNIEL
ncbi:MAG TPA: DUF134 domain-containing protein [Salinivirgaceae bacterium]|nr:DUF134 domain-containing protein [Salinivirgaceae bacterium]HQA76256.1 DUF134 domain-containing protein [Salinivirgaceae bacterium]